MKSDDYEHLFENLTEQIKDNVGEKLVDTLNFNFSTSNKTTKIVGYTSIMSAMKKYFKYSCFCHMCNFPYIILEGNLEDWESILNKTKDLSKYGLNEWYKALESMLLKIIETKKGKIDKEFWKKILYTDKIDEEIETDDYEYKTIKVDRINGWLLKFFPYYKDGNFRYEDSLKTEDLSRLPKKLLEIPFIMKSDDEGETEMTIYSGFFGMKVNKKKNNLVTAEIGWYVKENNNCLNQFSDDSDSS